MECEMDRKAKAVPVERVSQDARGMARVTWQNSLCELVVGKIERVEKNLWKTWVIFSFERFV